MIISDRLNLDVATFVIKFQAFLDAARGVLSETLSGPTPTSQMARNRLAERLSPLVLDYCQTEIDRVEDLTLHVAQTAIADALQSVGKRRYQARRDASLLDFAKESAHDVQLALIAQAQRDSRMVSKYLRDYALDVDRLLASSGHKYSSALIAVSQRKGSPVFSFMDRAGRNWQSGRYIETLIRSHLFSIYNDSFLYTLSWFGIESARVSNSGSKYDELMFAIGDSDDGIPTYESLKKTVFHPNSLAIVAK